MSSNGVAMMTKDPAVIIRRVHEMARIHGFEQTRLDQFTYVNDGKPTDLRVEIGYGCQEIKVRASNGECYARGIDRFELRAVGSLLDRLVVFGNERESNE